ncbi:MAG: hypothetical protein WCO00_16770 [Rhodospirillaceae bacterium]
MKFSAATFLFVGFAGAVFLSGAARADSDDKLWVAQCVRDNAGAEVATPVLLKYCKCMTNKMDDDENRSVAEWEPSHPAEKAACRSRAQWSASSAPPASMESPPAMAPYPPASGR